MVKNIMTAIITMLLGLVIGAGGILSTIKKDINIMSSDVAVIANEIKNQAKVADKHEKRLDGLEARELASSAKTN
jgi:hypothetical protein